MTAPATDRPSTPRRALTAVVVLVAVLAVAEVALRMLDLPAPSPIAFANPEWQDTARFQRTPRTFWRLAPDYDWGVPINRFGLCGHDPDERKTGRHFRIAVVGGGPAFGARVDFDASFAAQLERTVQDDLPGARVEVLLAAVPGFSTFQSLRLWQDVGPAFAPDLVVLYCGIDDCIPAAKAADADLAKARAEPSRWRLLQLLRQMLAAKEPTAEQLRHLLETDDAQHGRRVPATDFEANVRALIDAARAAGAEVCVVSPPLAPGLKRRPAFADYREALRRAVQARQAVLLDGDALITAFEASMDRPPCAEVGETHAFRDGTNLTPEAHALMAQLILARVRSHPRFDGLAELASGDTPTAATIDPTTVEALAGSEVKVVGHGFAATPGLRVWVGDQWATSLRVVDDETLVLRVPVELVPGTHALRITSALGLSPANAGVQLEVKPSPLQASLRRDGEHLQVSLDGSAPRGSKVEVFVAPAGRAAPIATRAGPFWLQVGVPGEKPARAPFCFGSLSFARFEAVADSGGKWRIDAPWQPDATFANAVLQGVVWLPSDRVQGVATEVAVRVVPR